MNTFGIYWSSPAREAVELEEMTFADVRLSCKTGAWLLDSVYTMIKVMAGELKPGKVRFKVVRNLRKFNSRKSLKFNVLQVPLSA